MASKPTQDPAKSGQVNGESDQQQAVISVEEEWDEEAIEKALARLKEMHIQLREMRTTIPKLLSPLTTKQESPEKLFTEFSAAAKSASADVRRFRDLMTDAEAVKVLEQAKKSRAERPANIKPWRITEHPDWSTRDK